MSIISHISEYIDDKSTKFGTHILLIYSFILNLVLITTDMVSGRHLEF